MKKTKESINLLEAHVQHELNSLRGDGLSYTIHEEIEALVEWFGKAKLNDLSSEDIVWKFFQRNFIHRPIADEFPKYVLECVVTIQKALKNDHTQLKTILSKKRYNKIVGEIFKMEDLRNDIIGQVVSSTIFSMLITETLYGGIKAFVFSDNLLMKNIPGASSLLNIGRGMLNKTTFGLSGNITDRLDKQIKNFVKANIKNYLKNSEIFLMEAFDEKLIRKSGDEIWGNIKNFDSHSLVNLMDKTRIESMVKLSLDFWNDFRKAPIFIKVSHTLIRKFFKIYGGLTILDISGKFGIQKEILIKELENIAIPVMEKDIVFRYLETRVRARLERYYFGIPMTKPEGNSPSGKSEAGMEQATPFYNDKKETKRISDVDALYDLIKKSKNGVDSKTLKKAAGLEAGPLQSMIKKLKQQKKIESLRRGVYTARKKH